MGLILQGVKLASGETNDAYIKLSKCAPDYHTKANGRLELLVWRDKTTREDAGSTEKYLDGKISLSIGTDHVTGQAAPDGDEATVQVANSEVSDLGRADLYPFLKTLAVPYQGQVLNLSEAQDDV